MGIPGKDPRMRIVSERPLNVEAPLDRLWRSFLTPTELFYVRDHGSAPDLDAASYRLRVGGLVARPLTLSLDELRARFPEVEETATLECAGNRRSELGAVAPVEGEPWGGGVIGTARWSGVRLRDVLEAAGVDARARHVAFESADAVEQDGERTGFGGSVPLAKAMRPEVILAFAMNGAPLPRDHGHPLRVVVPGYIGARSVKWLARVSLQEAPSESYFQRHAYTLGGRMLEEVPVDAVICAPRDGAAVRAGTVGVHGYAFAGGGRSIARVEVSVDGGERWTVADLPEREDGWAWTLWSARVHAPRGETEICARAWDSEAHTQPMRLEEIWNPQGYVNNAWHRVRVNAR
jgi:sulfite oxidase